MLDLAARGGFVRREGRTGTTEGAFSLTGRATPEARIGSVVLAEQPRIVLAVAADSKRLARALRYGADILEFRADQMPEPTAAQAQRTVRRLRRHGRPILLTIRSTREGGLRPLGDRQRRELFLALLPLVDAVDCELRSLRVLRPVVEAARQQSRPVLVSYHDFVCTPSLSVLERLFERARAQGADVVKVATQVQSREDLVRLFLFTWSRRTFPIVTMGMGTMASVSRLVLPIVGSRLIYTSLDPVLGQIPLARLVEDLRFYFPSSAGDPAAGRARS